MSATASVDLTPYLPDLRSLQYDLTRDGQHDAATLQVREGLARFTRTSLATTIAAIEGGWQIFWPVTVPGQARED
jgi:hypothetical protein